MTPPDNFSTNQLSPPGQATQVWHCPAKLNLTLQIIGQRKDGYHLLQSVFQMLDFGDELHIEITNTPEIELTCSQPELSGSDNLVVRAARLLQKHGQTTLGARLFLNKRLPAGGGIGGGSSDAATTLIALNECWKCGLSTSQLAKLGLQLGADVPFFVNRRTAFVEGIGEQITAIDLPPAWFLVVHPAVHVSTAEIFSDPMLTRNSKAIKIRDLNELGLPHQGRNSMQDVVCKHYPAVEQALNWLLQYDPNARMSGSGSCVFAVFDNEQEVRKIASRCEWPHFVAKGVNRSQIRPIG